MFLGITRARWFQSLRRLWLRLTGRSAAPSASQAPTEPEHRLISFVALLKEAMPMEPTVVATAASKAWDADLSAGEEGGEDGYVIGNELSMMIQFRDRSFLFNAIPRPYTDDPEKQSEQLCDLRLQTLYAKHTAWMSCDAFGITQETPDAEVRECYRLCGRLISRLIDDNTLAVILPDQDLMYPNTEELETLLQSDDPLEAVTGQVYAPVIPVSDEDPRMIAAVAEARRRWPEFEAAFETGEGRGFSVKNPLTRAGNTEFIWIQVTALENGIVYGNLANDPVNLGSLRIGARVQAPSAELNDWCFVNLEGQMTGGFTIQVIRDVASERTREQQQKEEAAQGRRSNRSRETL